VVSLAEIPFLVFTKHFLFFGEPDPAPTFFFGRIQIVPLPEPSRQSIPTE